MPENATRPGALYRLAWGFYLALGLGALVWIGARGGQIPAALFFDPGGWWVDLALGGAAAAALLAIWRLARQTLQQARELETHLGKMLGSIDASEAIGLAVLSGIAEELFFRGAVQAAWGWLPATILFALLHTGPGPSYRVWTAFAALAGLALAGLMLWRGNLLAPVTAHVLINAVNLRRLADSAAAQGDRSEVS